MLSGINHGHSYVAYQDCLGALVSDSFSDIWAVSRYLYGPVALQAWGTTCAITSDK